MLYDFCNEKVDELRSKYLDNPDALELLTSLEEITKENYGTFPSSFKIQSHIESAEILLYSLLKEFGYQDFRIERPWFFINFFAKDTYYIRLI